MSNIKETLREIGIRKNGALFYHHFKKDDSNMWMYWVKHNGFGRPRLKVKHVNHDVFYYFRFTCGKFQWYWAKRPDELKRKMRA